MRSAHIENGVVVNFCEVASFNNIFIDPLDSVMGATWDGVSFTAPPVLPPTRDQLKAQREAAVSGITVTTQAGNTFDGDEASQTRMARAIIALQATGTPSVLWVLTDNTVIDAPVAELVEALALAGAAQAAMWVIE